MLKKSMDKKGSNNILSAAIHYRVSWCSQSFSMLRVWLILLNIKAHFWIGLLSGMVGTICTPKPRELVYVSDSASSLAVPQW